jgi:hypothetical protein
MPYSEQMRLDQLGGLWAFLTPLIIGTFYAAYPADLILYPSQIASVYLHSLALAIISRGAACV